MKYLRSMLLLLSVSALQAQNNIKPEAKVTTDVNLVVNPAVGVTAQRAVQILGDNVKKGNFIYALEKMYPRYRRSQEAQFGADKLKQQFNEVGGKLNQMGVVIEKFTAERPTGYFQVYPQITAAGKAKIAAGGELGPNDTYYNWMVIVPTTQTWKFLDKNGGKPRYLKRQGFQVAVARVTTPGQEVWTFVDGDSATPAELRKLFTSLPLGLAVPETLDSEIKQ